MHKYNVLCCDEFLSNGVQLVGTVLRELTWRKHVNLCANLKRHLTASTESHTCPGLIREGHKQHRIVYSVNTHNVPGLDCLSPFGMPV